MNKTVLITGANKGIGFETARQLLSKGFNVIISGRDKAKLESALQLLKKEGESVDSLLMDVSVLESIQHAAEHFSKKNIALDVLINNAAILSSKDTSILQKSEYELQDAIVTNSYGPLRVVKSFLPFMNNPSKIINLSSGGGSMSEPVGGWSPAYCVSKTLLNSITRQLAHELKHKNISVNAACPGWTKTDMGGSGAPRSVAEGAATPVWLAVETSHSITGKFFRDKKEISW